MVVEQHRGRPLRFLRCRWHGSRGASAAQAVLPPGLTVPQVGPEATTRSADATQAKRRLREHRRGGRAWRTGVVVGNTMFYY